MANPYFEFKKFKVWQDKCAMKVGTDGVLLGAWTDVHGAKRMLDVGTGTGLVALMLAQRSQAAVVAVELDAAAALQAAENIKASPWPERIEVVQADFKTFETDRRFDVIVSNPPYFIDSLLSPNDARTLARHAGELTYGELLHGVSRLLTPDGVFSVIIPADVSETLTGMAANVGLHPVKRTDIITAPGKLPKRCLLAFGFGDTTCTTDNLLIETARHCYSAKYIALTKDFYLKM